MQPDCKAIISVPLKVLCLLHLPPLPEISRCMIWTKCNRTSSILRDELSDVHLLVEGIHCAACVWLIERGMMRIRGVHNANVNLAGKRLHLRWDNQRVKLSALILELSKIGYSGIPYDPEAAEGAMKKANRAMLFRLFFAGFTMMNLNLIAIALV